MAQTRKEYWSEVRSVYKDPKDYVIPMMYIFQIHGTVNWCILPMLMH